MSDSISHKFSDTNATLSATVTGEISVALVIIFLMLFVVALILYLRFKGYSGAIGSYNSRSRNLAFTPHQPDIPRKPLDPLILDSLPVIVFHAEDFKEEGSVECAICLSELTDGETVRFLPGCKHGFHVECIDMWFHSNSTCPLCRSPVRADDDVETLMKIPVLKYGHLAELQDSKASFDEGSSSSGNSFSEKEQKGMLVIEIPTWQDSSSSSITPLASSPALERLRTLQSILSRGNLNDVCVGSSCSPRGYDIGHGGMQKSLPVSESDGHSLV